MVHRSYLAGLAQAGPPCHCYFAAPPLDAVLGSGHKTSVSHHISRNWRSKGLRGIRSLRNSMSIENVWTHSENCS